MNRFERNGHHIAKQAAKNVQTAIHINPRRINPIKNTYSITFLLFNSLDRIKRLQKENFRSWIKLS